MHPQLPIDAKERVFMCVMEKDEAVEGALREIGLL